MSKGSTRLVSFTALDLESLRKVVEGIDDNFGYIKDKVIKALDIEANQRLKKDYLEAQDKVKFINDNISYIAAFLNDCGLIGYNGEKNDRSDVNVNTYVIGAEGISLVAAYLAAKEKDGPLIHKVEVVKNTNIDAKNSHSLRHIDVFLENEQIHDALLIKLREDLSQAGDAKFDKTYLLEVSGTAGRNHFTVLTIHKGENDKAPIVDLFDPSPAIIRNGLEAAENSIAGGWCGHFVINATIKKAFEEQGLRFENENFFNNSEPLQKPGSSICATFASDIAFSIAREKSEDHIEMLKQDYVYKSYYGGKTEVAINYESTARQDSEPYVNPPQFNLDHRLVRNSHFDRTAIDARRADLELVLHKRKDGQVENFYDKIMRYQAMETKISDQQTVRWKCHLMDIVCSEEFLGHDFGELSEIGKKYRDSFTLENPIKVSVPKFDASDSEQIRKSIELLNKILPANNEVNKFEHDGENLSMRIYLGRITTNRLRNFLGEEFMRENQIEFEERLIDFSSNIVSELKDLACINEVSIRIPEKNLQQLIERIESKSGELQSSQGKLPVKGYHAFAPSQATYVLDSAVVSGGLGSAEHR